MDQKPPNDVGVNTTPSVAFPPIFRYQEILVTKESQALRCNTKAKLEAGRVDMQGVMVRLPLKLRERIESQSAGALSVTICALAEYALERLETDNKGIVVTVAPPPLQASKPSDPS